MPKHKASDSKTSRKPEVSVSLDDDVLRRLDEWRANERRSRSNAAAVLIARALDAASKAAS
jgi:metal-responsive CopG/Arc/MetJ family transcriptional regulator